MTEVAVLEWGDGSNVREFDLDSVRSTIGKGAVDLVLRDRTVSRLHAVIERVTGGWVVQDLGSRNGTFVNGIRVVTPRALRSGDELRCGNAVLRFRASRSDESASVTAPVRSAPPLTNREHDALVALCRPILAGSILEEPATVADIAAELVVSESAAKKLLTRAYNKFELFDTERRRGRLALEAIHSGAVSAGDLDTERT